MNSSSAANEKLLRRWLVIELVYAAPIREERSCLLESCGRIDEFLIFLLKFDVARSDYL